MAHQDETTESGTAPDDCFDDPQIEETASSAATSDAAAERRLTVLSHTSSSDSGTDASVEADWFDDDGTTHVVPSILLDPENGEAVRIDRDSGEPIPHTGAERRSLAPDPDSFDSRTARLRDHRTATSTAPVQRSWWRRRRAAVAVAASLLLGGIGAAALWATDSNSENPTPQTLALDEIVTTTAVPTSTLPAAASAAAADVTWCTGQADGQPVTEDSADPGAAAIWRFEKAFYYDRNGAAARAAGAPDAVMASAQRLQQGIDQLEPDIEFCVLADPVDAGVYNVTVVERGPGIDGRMSRQRITTAAQPDGQTLITAIVPR